jgi:hypothetical protein
LDARGKESNHNITIELIDSLSMYTDGEDLDYFLDDISENDDISMEYQEASCGENMQ